MKKDFFKFLLALGAAIFTFISIADGSETLKGAKKDAEVFKQEMATRYKALETQIAEIKAEATKKGSTAKKETIRELEEARDNVKTKLAQASDETKSGWSNLKKNLSESMDALNTKVQKALKD